MALNDGVDAFGARIALIRGAEETLDLQYYIWQRDLTGLILLEASRHSYARIRPSGHAQRVAAPVLAPQPAASVSSRGEHRD